MRVVAPLLSLVLAASAVAQRAAPPQPLVFEPGAAAGTFVARAPGIAWRVDATTMRATTPGGEVSFTIIGADASADVRGERPTGGHSHYLVGNDPAAHRTAVPHFGAVRVVGVRPGVDVLFHAVARDLEFDIECAPGIDPGAVRLRIDAASTPQLTADGAVLVPLAGGDLRLTTPLVYQRDGAARVAVSCRPVLDGRELRFELGSYDPTRAVVIDPVVTFATLLGGAAGTEVVKGVAFDRFGNSAVVGTTTSTDFPLLNDLAIPYQNGICFVSKFDPAGNLVFSTFFGGTSGSVAPVDIGFDYDGLVVFGGNTTSSTLPTTIGVVQPTLVGGGDWFFTALQADGQLAWCTYYGGPGLQNGMRALHVLDVTRGSVVGVGLESGFPFMTSAYSQAGGVVVGGVFGGNVVWVSSACGFSGTPNAIDVTAQGHICITGTTIGAGSGLPTTGASYQPNPASNGSFDAFVFVFTGQANSLVFATYYGGTLSDVPRRIDATTAPGTILITIAGETNSIDLPLAAPVQTTKGAVQDGFVMQLDGATQTLVFASYLGGSDPGESVAGLGRDASGHTIVGMSSSSTDLPYTNTMKLPNPATNRDNVLWRLTPTGALDWCTAWGGSGLDQLVDLAVAASGEIVIAGQTAPTSFPVTPNALGGANASQDAYVAYIDPRSMTSYGQGSAGYGGPVPVLAGGGSTVRGAVARLQINDGRGQALGVLVAGAQRTNLPLFGGALLTNPLVSIAIQLGGSTPNGSAGIGGGYLYLPLTIPNDPGLVGARVDWQAALLDAAAVGGVALTNGVELQIQ